MRKRCKYCGKLTHMSNNKVCPNKMKYEFQIWACCVGFSAFLFMYFANLYYIIYF
jgi:hypothetical protein